MSHDHAGHDHTHGMAKQTLRLAFFLTLIILAAELAGGIVSHSLALLSALPGLRRDRPKNLPMLVRPSATIGSASLPPSSMR